MPPRTAVPIALAVITLLGLAAMPAVVNQLYIPNVAYFPTDTPTVTATPTATSVSTATSTPTPTATEAATSTPTATPTATEIASGPCSCSGNLYNCDDFSSQGAAQACFDFCVGQGQGDIHRLDQDNDNIACESAFPLWLR